MGKKIVKAKNMQLHSFAKPANFLPQIRALAEYVRRFSVKIVPHNSIKNAQTVKVKLNSENCRPILKEYMIALGCSASYVLRSFVFTNKKCTSLQTVIISISTDVPQKNASTPPKCMTPKTILRQNTGPMTVQPFTKSVKSAIKPIERKNTTVQRI